MKPPAAQIAARPTARRARATQRDEPGRTPGGRLSVEPGVSVTVTLFLLATSWASPLTDLLQSELDHAMGVFATQPEVPHYLALAVTDRDAVQIHARGGTIGTSSRREERVLDVDMRVGTPELDSTHVLRGFSALEGSSRGMVLLPRDSDRALTALLRSELDAQYRDHAERIVMIRANLNVKVEEEDPAPDFSPRPSRPACRPPGAGARARGRQRTRGRSCLVELSAATSSSPTSSCTTAAVSLASGRTRGEDLRGHRGHRGSCTATSGRSASR